MYILPGFYWEKHAYQFFPKGHLRRWEVTLNYFYNVKVSYIHLFDSQKVHLNLHLIFVEERKDKRCTLSYGCGFLNADYNQWLCFKQN